MLLRFRREIDNDGYHHSGLVIILTGQRQYLLHHICPQVKAFTTIVIAFCSMQLPWTDGMPLGIGKQNAVYQPIVAIPLVYQLMHSLGLGGSNDIDAGLLYMDGDVQTASGDVQWFSAMCRQQLLYQLPLAVLVHGVEHTHNLIHKCHNAPLVHIVRLHQCLWGEVRNHSSLQYRYLRNL